jgi:hypothetical protein
MGQSPIARPAAPPAQTIRKQIRQISRQWGHKKISQEGNASLFIIWKWMVARSGKIVLLEALKAWMHEEPLPNLFTVMGGHIVQNQVDGGDRRRDFHIRVFEVIVDIYREEKSVQEGAIV